jgi:hypothetical protein
VHLQHMEHRHLGHSIPEMDSCCLCIRALLLPWGPSAIHVTPSMLCSHTHKTAVLMAWQQQADDSKPTGLLTGSSMQSTPLLGKPSLAK